MEKNLADTIDIFIKDFEPDESSQVYIKLQILKLIAQRKKNKEIIESLYPLSELKRNTCEKKIKRIRNQYTQIYQLPQLIGTKELVNLILNKYPTPILVGFPFIFWTAKRLRRYIRLYFGIELRTEFSKKLSITTIERYMSGRKIDGNGPMHILMQSINNRQYYDFYYLMVIKKRYGCLTHNRKPSRRYDTLYYMTLFHLVDGIPEWTEYRRAISIRDSRHYRNSLASPKDELSLKAKTTVPNNKKFVILFGLSNRAKVVTSRWYNKLEYIPEFQWVIFKSYEELYSCLAEDSFGEKIAEKYVEGFETLEEIETKCRKCKKKNFISFKDEKNFYIHEIETIIKDCSG